MTQTKFDRPTLSALQSRHERKRYGGTLKAAASRHSVALHWSHDSGDRSGDGHRDAGSPQLHSRCLPQGWIQHAIRIDRMGEGSRSGRSGHSDAAKAVRAESEDAEVLQSIPLGSSKLNLYASNPSAD